jgi:hypothetical protein
MSTNYDSMTGILDLTDTLVVEIDGQDVTACLEGNIPQYNSGDPYRHGFYCRDQYGKKVLVTTDMDSQALVV